jgi:hypothetical protein
MWKMQLDESDYFLNEMKDCIDLGLHRNEKTLYYHQEDWSET